jgi:hypothetical protein
VGENEILLPKPYNLFLQNRQKMFPGRARKKAGQKDVQDQE